MSQAQVTVKKSSTRAANKTQAAPKSLGPVLAFRMSTNYRPSAGAALAAHTEAFLIASGLYDGWPVPRAMLADMIGQTAIGYHERLGNIERTENGITLTERGCNVFGARKVDPELLATLLEILATGDTSRDTGFLPKDWKRGTHAVNV